MCWQKLFKIFNKKPLIPHPEEAMNPLATFQNTDIEQVRQKWFTDWQVPIKYHAFWLDVRIILVENLTVIINGKLEKVPAATYAEEKRMSVDPKYANAGILAHESAHISYSLLSMEQKADFVNEYRQVLLTDPLLKLLYSQKENMKKDSIEAHGDIGRYLGQFMSKNLKPFYPKLYDV